MLYQRKSHEIATTLEHLVRKDFCYHNIVVLLISSVPLRSSRLLAILAPVCRQTRISKPACVTWSVASQLRGVHVEAQRRSWTLWRHTQATGDAMAQDCSNDQHDAVAPRQHCPSVR